ncbi:T9SS type A sorting domain-containing protein [Fluviicola chungangensis]|uniref:T9SS type A sorting domain-containing protein n=1 Tax=Fluviicola chungangensis TaxID=2597671 RepID=A0A556N0I1_9FLAO|nr:T9SS type A sorting domain-containing protein [Fluviicola chungangensis]TSJ45593.1 T9SS type A sorting domain-containing protein [Fluviicola chungangensis]
MKIIFSFILIFPLFLTAQYSDPNVGKPTSGYGSDGTYTVASEAFNNDHYNGENIVIYHPQEITTPVPTIFYSHGYGGNNPVYIKGLTDFVAKKGYALVFVPYQTLGVTVPDRYANLLEGFRKAARDYPDIIDTTRAAFMGHSFGGGASFGNAFTCFTENNWGSNGRFIYVSAEWYSYNINQNDLQSFPSDVKLVTEIYESDSTNDHRLAADIFRNISISNAEKDFLVLQRDTVNGYVYPADHNTPNTVIALNAHDYYGIYRILDALADYTWNGNMAAKDVCLGNGSSAQVTLPGGLKPMLQTDAPYITRPMSSYQFPCDSTINLRIAYCEPLNGISENERNSINIYPNPFQSDFVLKTTIELTEIHVFDVLGHELPVNVQKVASGYSFEAQYLKEGVYFVQTNVGVVQLIKNGK